MCYVHDQCSRVGCADWGVHGHCEVNEEWKLNGELIWTRIGPVKKMGVGSGPGRVINMGSENHTEFCIANGVPRRKVGKGRSRSR